MKIISLFKDRWLSEVLDQTNDFNKTQLPHCSRVKSSNRMMSDNDDANRDESHFNIEENTSVDQAITDLSILEYQLINSVSRRNDPVSITEELKNAIINHLDHYFADKDADVFETSELDYQEQSVVAHKPYINQYNQSTSDIRIIIDNLNEAQMYMFQVYACSDITKPSLSDFCSLNGITKEIRTQPGDRMYFIDFLIFKANYSGLIFERVCKTFIINKIVFVTCWANNLRFIQF